MSDLTDAALELALRGECHTVEVVVWLAREVKRGRDAKRAMSPPRRREDVRGADLTDAALELALRGECHTVEVVVWLAREVKRGRDAKRAMSPPRRREDVRGTVLRALERHLVGSAPLAVVWQLAETLTSAALTSSREGLCEGVTAALDQHLVGSAALGVSTRDQIAEAIADELNSAVALIQLLGNAPLEVFPFVTSLHREVVLRHKDDESQDIEMTPDEADLVADRLHAAAAAARTAKVEIEEEAP